MLNEYEINSATLALIHKGDNCSKIIEENVIYYISKNINDIIDESCKYFGSSYIGRIEGTKKLLGISSKLPIIIEESREIIFFPTHSPRNKKCIWLNLNQLKHIVQKGKNAQIVFNNNKTINTDISYYSLENQYLRANLLKSVLQKRKIE